MIKPGTSQTHLLSALATCSLSRRAMLRIAILAVTAFLGISASAHAATGGGYPYASMPCEHAPYSVSGSCANYDWGPKHTARYNDSSEISPYGYAYRNCTDFVAWKLASLGVPARLYRGHGNAQDWAKIPGLTTNTMPAVGAVAVQTTGEYGHVAFITAVSGSTITVAEYNYHENGTYDTRTGTLSSLKFNRVTHFESYEHGTAAAAPAPTPSSTPATTATSSSAPASSAPASAPAPAATPAPTYAETTGSVANTWTDAQDAGGSEGAQISSNQTVQIACWVSGFKVSDGNTYWYQIASSPWNGSYYVSADAFYNNGATSGSLHGTPFVDPNVPEC